jgi:cysteine synthase A
MSAPGAGHDKDNDHGTGDGRGWVDRAIRDVEADANRSADTHLVPVRMPAGWDVDIYLKDESTHPTGSLKHRLARSLFLYALCNGQISEGTTIVEASSGSTAVSEAYFARMLGLPFVAVMPAATSAEKIALIEHQGGACHLVQDASTVYDVARDIADARGGCYLDQFTYAERATDWRGNNNIAESIFQQMELERRPVPTWIVVGAGTGGTSATIGRFLRYRRHPTRLAVVDPENSAFLPSWRGEPVGPSLPSSRIEGIGRPRVEPSFQPGVVDLMVAVPDAGSIAGAHFLSELLGRRVGGSTGTNIWGALKLACQMRADGIEGSIVTLLCDGGERYSRTYYDLQWLADCGLDLAPSAAMLRRAYDTGEWPI